MKLLRNQKNYEIFSIENWNLFNKILAYRGLFKFFFLIAGNTFIYDIIVLY